MDEVMVENVLKLTDEIWKTEEIPEDWNLALICPIHNKNDRKKYNN